MFGRGSGSPPVVPATTTADFQCPHTRSDAAGVPGTFWFDVVLPVLAAAGVVVNIASALFEPEGGVPTAKVSADAHHAFGFGPTSSKCPVLRLSCPASLPI